MVCGTSDGDARNALEIKDMDQDVTDPTAPRSIGKCTRDVALLRAYTPTQFKAQQCEAKLPGGEGRLSRVTGKAALRLEACSCA